VRATMSRQAWHGGPFHVMYVLPQKKFPVNRSSSVSTDNFIARALNQHNVFWLRFIHHLPEKENGVYVKTHKDKPWKDSFIFHPEVTYLILENMIDFSIAPHTKLFEHFFSLANRYEAPIACLNYCGQIHLNPDFSFSQESHQHAANATSAASNKPTSFNFPDARAIYNHMINRTYPHPRTKEPQPVYILATTEKQAAQIQNLATTLGRPLSCKLLYKGAELLTALPSIYHIDNATKLQKGLTDADYIHCKFRFLKGDLEKKVYLLLSPLVTTLRLTHWLPRNFTTSPISHDFFSGRHHASTANTDNEKSTASSADSTKGADGNTAAATKAEDPEKKPIKISQGPTKVILDFLLAPHVLTVLNNLSKRLQQELADAQTDTENKPKASGQ
jgi:hypothetical protein